MNRTLTLIPVAAALAIAATSTLAQSKGDWSLGIGVGYLDPKSDNGDLAGLEASVSNDVRPIFTAEYFFWDNIGVEILLATPFKHDISLSGLGRIGDSKHLPPTVSVNYHFPTDSVWKPYVGAGINYTKFFEEDSILGDLDIDSSWGISLQAGIDYQVSEAGAVRLNLRWFDIDSDVTLNGSNIGEAEIDPFLVGISYVHRF